MAAKDPRGRMRAGDSGRVSDRDLKSDPAADRDQSLDSVKHSLY